MILTQKTLNGTFVVIFALVLLHISTPLILDAQESTVNDPVKIAVIDTGYDIDNGTTKIAGGYNSSLESDNPADYVDFVGHGTNVVDVVGKTVEENNINAEIYVVKIEPNQEGQLLVGDVARGIDWAVENDIDVINLSLGCTYNCQDLEEAIARARNDGIAINTSAGNCEPTCTVTYPGGEPEVMVTGATDWGGNILEISSMDGAPVDFVAPGIRPNRYVYDDSDIVIGTSFAAPHVTALIAGVKASPIEPEYDVNGDGEWNPSEINKKLHNTDTEHLYMVSLPADRTRFLESQGYVYDYDEGGFIHPDHDGTLFFPDQIRGSSLDTQLKDQGVNLATDDPIAGIVWWEGSNPEVYETAQDLELQGYQLTFDPTTSHQIYVNPVTGNSIDITQLEIDNQANLASVGMTPFVDIKLRGGDTGEILRYSTQLDPYLLCECVIDVASGMDCNAALCGYVTTTGSIDSSAPIGSSFNVLFSYNNPDTGMSGNTTYTATIRGPLPPPATPSTPTQTTPTPSPSVGGVPSGGSGGPGSPGVLVPCNGPDCTACDFVKLGNNVLNWLIGVLMIVFSIIAAYAGFRLATSAGNVQAKSDAKSMLTNAIVGLIIVLAGWILVDTIMRALLAGGTGEIEGYGPWSRIECGKQTTFAPPAPAPVTPSGGVSPNTTGLSEAEVLTAFNNEGIGVVSSGSCTDPSNPTCTGLAGLQQSTVDNVIAINSACPDCGIVVTSGTETGHTNSCHVAGTCVDIDCRPNDCTVDQINTVYTSASTGGMKAVYEVKTEEREQELVDAGVNPDAIDVVDWITGEHFSLYDR